MLALGRSLGTGAFGSVQEAYWGSQPCAAKTFFVSKSDFHQQAIQKEISVLQALRYRHIIQFYRTHEEEDGRIYLLMELAEKGSLARAIAKGELGHHDWETKIRIASEIAQGLAFMHQEKILHRDLKSANVLLTKHMEVKIADFGLAKVKSMINAASMTDLSEGGLKGTLRWIAPELLFTTKPQYSTKSDVYALGVVMWEMAANCTRPFQDLDNDALVALAVSNGSRDTLPADTPTKYRSWVERCWDQYPTRRPMASEVVWIHEEPTRGGTDNDDDDETLTISFSQSNCSGDLGKDGNIEGALENGGRAFKNHDGQIGPLPSTNDRVIASFCMAAKLGNVDGQLFLGWIYEHGRGVHQSYENSYRWYRQAALQGHVVAQLRVAEMREHGQGVDTNHEKAVLWYRRAADGGSADAHYQLGQMYADGRGVKQDDVEAARLYRIAADLEHPEAQTILGLWYSLGRGVTQSDADGVKWLRRAADHGNMTAQHHIGLMYLQGLGVQQCDVAAAQWFRKAAEQGDADAQQGLGWIYYAGRGVEQSDVDAVVWFAKAAEQGNLLAQSNYGAMYTYGRGIEQNYVEAVKWFTKAAERGSAVSQSNLGLMYERGRGVEMDVVEAAKWYTKAAEQGDESAQSNLGVMYKQGRGVEQSDVEAVRWFAKAQNGARQLSTTSESCIGKGEEFNKAMSRRSSGTPKRQNKDMNWRSRISG